jgi:hypothetical protein
LINNEEPMHKKTRSIVRLPLKRETIRALTIGELLHAAVVGASEPTSGSRSTCPECTVP